MGHGVMGNFRIKEVMEVTAVWIIGAISLAALTFIIGWNMSRSRSTNIYPANNRINAEYARVQQPVSNSVYYRPVSRTPPPLPPALPSRPMLPPPATGTQISGLPMAGNARRSSVYDFPKCPICRKRNIKGKPQEVFWSPQRRMYYCNGKHSFTGRD